MLDAIEDGIDESNETRVHGLIETAEETVLHHVDKLLVA